MTLIFLFFQETVLTCKSKNALFYCVVISLLVPDVSGVFTVADKFPMIE